MEFVLKCVIVITVTLTCFIHNTFCYPNPGMSDLFMDGSYFRGLPNPQSDAGTSDLGTFFDVGDTYSSQIDIAIASAVSSPTQLDGRVDPTTNEGWPGRVLGFPLSNSGKDVVTVYAQNLKNHTDRIFSLTTQPMPRDIVDRYEGCVQTCMNLNSISKTGKCAMMCVGASHESFQEVTSVLYSGMKTLCHSTNTLYTKLEKFNIKSLKQFKSLVNKLKSPQPIGESVPLRALLVKMINEVLSTITPYQAVIEEFESRLRDKTERKLNLIGRVLVEAHPGCAMISMRVPIQHVFQTIYYDASLADHLLFQGYSLFTSVTKYLGDFPTKKEFAVVNHGLDMMLGTTCGLFLYGDKDMTSNCDQYGGNPVLDMPIPDFMWTADIHAECEKVRAKLLQSKAEAGAAAASPDATEKRRRKRSLVLGRRSGL